jgi:ATP-dependent helicase/nuclease subunit A
MILTEQLAVMDLLALGRFVLLPEDDLTLAVVLKGPMFGFTDNEDLFPLAYNRSGTLWEALKKASSSSSIYQIAYERLAKLRGRANYTPPQTQRVGLFQRVSQQEILKTVIED